jgi:cellulase
MKSFVCTLAASLLAFGALVDGHTTMFGISVNGVDQGDGRNVYIRSPSSNSPVKILTSSDLVCNDKGATAAPQFVSAAAGASLSFEWFHDTRGDDIIDLSHKGPVITYIAAFTDSTGNGASAIWSKIAEDGFDATTQKWAVDKLVANKGKANFTLPSDLKAGKYLIRQEIIALHEADASVTANPNRGAQFYPSCVQVEVTGSGTTVPSQSFDFNTGYNASTPGIVFNIYGTVTSYPIPGPAVFASGSTAAAAKKASRASMTERRMAAR